MVEYRKNAHSVWDVKYHVIWVTKYRYKVLRGEIAVRTRDLLR
jgi:putative transposase